MAEDLRRAGWFLAACAFSGATVWAGMRLGLDGKRWGIVAESWVFLCVLLAVVIPDER